MSGPTSAVAHLRMDATEQFSEFYQETMENLVIRAETVCTIAQPSTPITRQCHPCAVARVCSCWMCPAQHMGSDDNPMARKTIEDCGEVSRVFWTCNHPFTPYICSHHIRAIFVPHSRYIRDIFAPYYSRPIAHTSRPHTTFTPHSHKRKTHRSPSHGTIFAPCSHHVRTIFAVFAPCSHRVRTVFAQILSIHTCECSY